jgi:hypothetical protein
VNIASETNFDESKPVPTCNMPETTRADGRSPTQPDLNLCRRKNLTKPKEPAPTGGTEPQDSNPDLKTTQITETATAQRPNLTDLTG